MKTNEAQPVVELENLTVEYPYHTALEDITFSVGRGELLAIVGPNGAGKTTLLKALLGLIRPSRGEVRVFGKAPWELGAERHRIGYVPQGATGDPKFPAKVRDVVVMGRYGRIGVGRRPSAEDHEAARRAMDRVGIAHLQEEPIARLSGGQRQRAFLARALGNDPSLLLLDEPTTGVDVLASETFYELLHGLRSDGITILVVSHDIGVVAAHADSVACVNQRLALHGRPEEVKSGTVLACMYGPHAAFLDHGPVPHVVVGKDVHSESDGEGEDG
jgi:ABC-type Mn2+/Zn2+ transport system ATPase subunit